MKIEKIRNMFYLIIFNSVLLSDFIKMHFAQDTYCTIAYGIKETVKNTFLKSGRPITALALYSCELFNISIEKFVIVMSIIGVIAVNIAMYILFTTIKKLYSTDIIEKKLMIGSLVFITVLNFCTLELFVFAESGLLCIALLLSIMAACENVSDSKFKYFRMCINLIIAVMIHQSILNIYIPLSLMFIVIKNKESLRKIIKETIIIFAIYGLAIIINILTGKCINLVLGITQRPTIIPTIKYIITTYYTYLKIMVLNTFYIGIKYWYVVLISIIAVAFTIKNILLKNKKIFLLYYFLILLSSILLPILPVLLEEQQTQYLELRMAISFGSSIGILILFDILTNQNMNTVCAKIISIICLALFAINGRYIIVASSEMNAANLLDRNYAEIVINRIEKYETENNTKIKNIAIDYDRKAEPYYSGCKHYRCLNYKSLTTKWATVNIIEVYSNRDFNEITITEDIHNKYFANKDWSNYSEEQLVFENDTLYLCIY